MLQFTWGSASTLGQRPTFSEEVKSRSTVTLCGSCSSFVHTGGGEKGWERERERERHAKHACWLHWCCPASADHNSLFMVTTPPPLHPPLSACQSNKSRISLENKNITRTEKKWPCIKVTESPYHVRLSFSPMFSHYYSVWRFIFGLCCVVRRWPQSYTVAHTMRPTHSKTKVKTCTLSGGLAAISQSSTVWCLSSHDHLHDGFSICVVIVAMYIWLLLLVMMNLFKNKQKKEHVLSMDLLNTHIAVRCGNTVIDCCLLLANVVGQH